MQFLPTSALSQRAADFSRTYHHVKAGAGIVLSDLVRPSFWSHHTARLDVGDLVDVVADDGSYDVSLRVIGKKKIEGTNTFSIEMRAIRVLLSTDEPMIERQAAAVSRSAPVPEEAPQEIPHPGTSDDVPGFRIEHAGRARWRVIRRADAFLLKQGMTSKDEAIAWAREHMGEIAA